MIETRSKWGEIISGVGIQVLEVYDQATELYQAGISNLLKVESSSVGQKNFTGKVSENTITRKDEGEATEEISRYKTYVTSVDYTTYAGKLEITKENIDDRDFSAQLDEAADLAKASQFSQDEAGVQLFNGGFTTRKDSIKGYRYQYYNDGVPTFSTIHPTVVPGVSTQSNASGSSIVLSDANLETARLALRKQMTDAGGPLTMGGQETIVVPLALEKTARVITESELLSNSGNNDFNVYKGTVGMVTSQLFDSYTGGSNTAWYLIVPGATKFVHDVREGMSPWMTMDEDTGTFKFGVRGRWANYTKDWRRAWGSLGTAGAYTA